jgi:predicted chitinase
METTFTGLRQSIYTVPVENDITTFLNVDLNEVDEIAQRLKVSNFLNQLNETNYDFAIINPTTPFGIETLEVVDLDRLFTNGSGVGSSNIKKELLLNSLKQWLPRYGVTTNSQVSNFLAQCSHESLNFNPNWVIEKWDGDPEPDENGVATNGSSAQLKYEGNSDLGNTVTGDGLRFKGRGFIQVTGRKNYKNLEKDSIAGELFKGITIDYNNPEGWKRIDELFNATTQEGVDRCLVASLIWWKNSGVGSLTNGTVAEAQTVSRRVNPFEGDKKQNLRIQKLEKVVDVFNLKTDYNG